MENLTLAVIRRLGEMMPELATIDEDYGQLAYDEAANSYPVVFPAAFEDRSVDGILFALHVTFTGIGRAVRRISSLCLISEDPF